MLVMSIMDSFGLGILVPVLQQMQNGTGVPGDDPLSRFTALALSFVGLKYSFANLIFLFALVMLVKFSLQAWLEYHSRYLSSKMQHRLRVQALQNLIQHHPMPFYHQKSSGALIATIHTSSEYGGAVAEYLTALFTGMLTIGLYVCLSLLISPVLTVLTLLAIVVSYKFTVPRFRATARKGEEHKRLIDIMVSHLHEILGGIRIVKAFTQEEKHIREFEAISDATRRISLRLMLDKVVVSLFVEPYGTVLIIVLMVASVMYLRLEFSALLTFFVVFARLAPRLKQANTQYLHVLECLPHLKKVHEIIVAEFPEIKRGAGQPVPDRIGDLLFDDVWFRYENREEFALRGVGMAIRRGQCTALVGSSGVGKTTIVDLLLMNLVPTKGRIWVGEQDLECMSREEWLRRIGIVEQEPFLFRSTIADNICYGKPGATQGEIEAAARLANAHEFIAALPNGYGTMVGDRGAMISGGQKQRIALARALVRDPAILILDEATSFQDAASERLIQEAIERLGRLKTIIVIAHRFSAVVNADWIVFLENGRVVETGSHHDLVERDGSYARSFRLQTTDFRGK